jgi:serine/threonine-protein kinase RsbW
LTLTRQIRCLAIPSSLAALLDFVDEACREAGLDEQAQLAVRLAGEEACSNIIEHAYRGREPGPIALELRHEQGRVVLVIEDAAPAFAPDDAPPPDLSSDWVQRRMGGLGWHLIRQTMDEVRHQRLAGGGNRLELVKRLPAGSGT